MSTEQTITAEQANQLRTEYNRAIALRDHLIRLENNNDFQKFIEEYTKEEPVRLVSLLAEPSFNLGGKKELHREEIQERMIGIARFKEYIRNVYLLASKAEQSLAELNKAQFGSNIEQGTLLN